MGHDAWKTWSDALGLLQRDESHLQIGAIAILKQVAEDDQQLAGPTVEVLKMTLIEWESQEPGPPAQVKTAAQQLVASLEASLEDDSRAAGRRSWLSRVRGRRRSDKSS